MEFTGFTRGMGIGGWLTNYKRFNVLPLEWRLPLSIGDFEHFETYISQRDIDYIAELGLDHVRLGFDQIVLEEKPGVYRENILQILDRFIRWCENAKLNVVLNLHKAVGNYCDIPEPLTLLDSAELQERFIALWCMLEKRYSTKPEIAFELLNEVRDVDPAAWNALAEKTIRAIRQQTRLPKVPPMNFCPDRKKGRTGSLRRLPDLSGRSLAKPEAVTAENAPVRDFRETKKGAAGVLAAASQHSRTRKIIIGSTRWNGIRELKLLKVFADPNVVYTFHCYSPFEFTHQQGVLQAPTLYYNRAMPYPGDIERYRDYQRFVCHAGNPYPGMKSMDREFLRETLRPAFEFAEAHPDRILWCGEFGTIRHCKLEYRENYMRDLIALLKEHHIPYCVWNYLSTPNDGNRFSLVDDDNRKILSEEMARIIRGEVC